MAWLTRHSTPAAYNNDYYYYGQPTTQHSNHDLHHVWQHQPQSPPPPYRYSHGSGTHTRMQRSRSVSSDHDVEQADDMRMPFVLPPAETGQTPASRPPTAAYGCGYPSDGGAGDDASTGLENEGADLCSAQDAWECLLEDIRGAEKPGEGRGGRKRHRSSGDEEENGDLVEIQPSNRVLLAQGNRETCASLWVVNSTDWIDVEYVLRRMLKCEASECHAFYSIGYVFFRSCAVSHVTSPSAFLKDGVYYRFPDTEVVVAITHAHEEGVLQVECYLEYSP